MSNSLLLQQEALRTLATQVREAVNAEPRATGWSSAFLDVRYARDGTRLKKIRAIVGGRQESISVLYGTIDSLTKALWQEKSKNLFYGILLTLSQSGEVEVQLNYDPNCFTDPTFFDS